MSKRFAVGDHVFYHGICKVEDICLKKFGKGSETLFYLLRPLSDPGCMTYVPVESEIASKIRELLSPEDLNALIDGAEMIDRSWISDPKERSAAFSDLLLTADATTRLWLFKAMSLYKDRVEGRGRRFYASDCRLLDSARASVVPEFAFVLGIDESEVVKYITDRVPTPSEIRGF